MYNVLLFYDDAIRSSAEALATIRGAVEPFSNVRLVPLDVTSEHELRSRFAINGVPTIVVTDASGNLVGRHLGWLSTSDCMTLLRDLVGSPGSGKRSRSTDRITSVDEGGTQ